MGCLAAMDGEFKLIFTTMHLDVNLQLNTVKLILTNNKLAIVLMTCGNLFLTCSTHYHINKTTDSV